jgi:ureidoglycolate dehydrogenase (NAD+)
LRCKRSTKVQAAELRRFFVSLFEKAGVSRSDAALVIEGLIQTSLRGVDSHGIRLIPHYLQAASLGRVDLRAKPIFRKTGRSTGILDAKHGFGIPAGIAGMEKAISLAKEAGVGAVSVRNSSHFGAASIYALHAARKNMIGFACTHSDSFVFPYGGARIFLGTNPICFAAPCSGRYPFVLDMATSRISWNKLRQYRAQGEKLPPGMAADRYGAACTDPHLAVGLLTAGEYKGYGLSLVVEILCSTLTGMPAGPKVPKMFPVDNKRRRLGHFFVAVDISRFTKIKEFRSRLSALLKALRAVPPAPEVKKVLVAGDLEWETLVERLRTGIPIPKEDCSEFQRVAKKLCLPYKNLDWLTR